MSDLNLDNRLSEAKKEYEDLETDIANFKNWPKEKAARFGELAKIAGMADELEIINKEITEIAELTEKETDAEMKRAFEEESKKLEVKKDSLVQKIKDFFEPKVQERENEAILEIRAGAGGDEASLFAQDLFNMYQKYALKNGWFFSLIDEIYYLQVLNTIVIIIRPMRGWRHIDLSEIWRYRELLYFLVWRDIKVRYKQTVFGVAWAIMQPFFIMVIFPIIINHSEDLFTELIKLENPVF